MKLYAICKVKNASPSPPQAAAEPEPALGGPTQCVRSFIHPKREKADFAREGYTV